MQESNANCLAMEGNQKSWVRCNNFIGAGNGIGTGLYSAGAYESILSCNISSQTFLGFNFEGMGDLVQLQGNTLLEHSIGLRISPDGIIGAQRYQGNKWCGEYLNGMAAVHEGNDIGISQSPFYIDPNLLSLDGCDLLPTVQADGDWFRLLPPNTNESTFLCQSENNNACEASSPGPPSEEAEEEIAHPLVDGNLDIGAHETPLLWTGRRHLYNRWVGQTGLESWQQGFVNAQATNSIGAFYDVDSKVSSALALENPDRKLLEEMLEAQLIWADSLHQLDSLFKGSNDSTAAHIKALRSQVLDHLRQNEVLILPLLNSLASERQLLANQALQANQAISVGQVFEQNEKNLNAVLIKKWAKGNITFTNAEKNTLLQIAAQCPQAGGDAVFKARSLYRLVDPLAQFDNDLLCGGSQALARPEQQTAEPAKAYRLYPNPARDEVVLEWLQPLEQDVVVEVYDLYGRLRAESRLEAGKNTLVLDTSLLENGVFYAYLKEGNSAIRVELIHVFK